MEMKKWMCQFEWSNLQAIYEYDSRCLSLIVNGEFVSSRGEHYETEAQFKESALRDFLDLLHRSEMGPLPKAWTNQEEEFIYPVSTGYQSLTGYEQGYWPLDQLTDEQLNQGRFFLKESNLVVPQLKEHQTYSLILSGSKGSAAYVDLTKIEVIEFIQEPQHLNAYLEGRLLIFNQEFELFAQASDLRQGISLQEIFIQNRYRVYPLAEARSMQHTGQYYNAKTFLRQTGIILNKYVLKPTAFYETSNGEYDKLYALDDIPQEIICFCGQNQRTTGSLEERLCPHCLTARRAAREKHIKRKVQRFFTGKSTKQEVLILSFVTSKTEPGAQKKMVDVCLMTLEGEMIYHSYVQSLTPLTPKLLDRGYQETELQEAPHLDLVLDDLMVLIKDREVFIRSRQDLNEVLRGALKRKQFLKMPARWIEWERAISPYLELKRVLQSDHLKGFEGEEGVIRLNELTLMEIPTIRKAKACLMAQDFSHLGRYLLAAN